MKERVRVDIYRHILGFLKASRSQWVESNMKIVHGTSSSQVSHDQVVPYPTHGSKSSACLAGRNSPFAQTGGTKLGTAHFMPARMEQWPDTIDTFNLARREI